MTKKILTQDLLKEALHYCPDSGVFTWKTRPREHFPTTHGWNGFNARYAGNVAGTFCSGYRVIRINGEPYKAHRLAWLYMNGAFPLEHIDHINRNRADNCRANLRAVTHVENMKNQKTPKSNKSGWAGVAWHKNNERWCANITVNYKMIHLGSFKSKLTAIGRRKRAEIFYGFHENHGKAPSEIS